MKILLVDDSRSAAEVFAERLRVLGHEVSVAHNGQEGVELFRRVAPELVLMDIEMPVMNGFEATRHIREVEAAKEWAWTPILFLTSVGTDENIVTAIEAGGDALIPKNVSETVLRVKMKAMTRVAALRQNVVAANRQLAEELRLRALAEAELASRYDELSALNLKLSRVQGQLIQSEKMASVGQLAAGVAHEINTPIAYVSANIGTLQHYVDRLLHLVEIYSECVAGLPPERVAAAEQCRSEIDFEHLRADAVSLGQESRDGIERVKTIVHSLKEFAQIGVAGQWRRVDLHRGIDATLDLLGSEVAAKADVVREYGVLPAVECMPDQLNQVFMSLLVNAEHAFGKERGLITIRTGIGKDGVWLVFEDNGCGMPDDVRRRIFDPFFTTKPPGKGLGLGLSLSYGIIRGHGGSLTVDSAVRRGSRFRITLPIRQCDVAEPA